MLIDAKPHKTTIDVMWRLHVAETNQVNGVPIEVRLTLRRLTSLTLIWDDS